MRYMHWTDFIGFVYNKSPHQKSCKLYLFANNTCWLETAVYFVFTELEDSLLFKLPVIFIEFSCNVCFCVPDLAVKP